MRLESGNKLPAGLRTLLRLQYLLVFAVVAVAVWVWVPEPAAVAGSARVGLVLAASYVWFCAALNLLRVAEHRSVDLPGVLAFMVLLMAAALVALLLSPLPGALLVLASVALLQLPEKTTVLAQCWPTVWLAGRSQQGRLLLVALASITLALWYPANWPMS